MHRMRAWSVRNARWLKALYSAVEIVLRAFNPLLRRIGHERLDRPFVAVEKLTKGFLLDSKQCGQCIVGFTGMSCPMNCPKKIRNGPCGGVRGNGACEVDPDMPCVWVLAWEGNKRLGGDGYPIQILQPPVNHQTIGKSAWLHELRRGGYRASPQGLAGNESYWHLRSPQSGFARMYPAFIFQTTSSGALRAQQTRKKKASTSAST